MELRKSFLTSAFTGRRDAITANVLSIRGPLSNGSFWSYVGVS